MYWRNLDKFENKVRLILGFLYHKFGGMNHKTNS